jgi:chemotaxis signal transduction protein
MSNEFQATSLGKWLNSTESSESAPFALARLKVEPTQESAPDHHAVEPVPAELTHEQLAARLPSLGRSGPRMISVPSIQDLVPQVVMPSSSEESLRAAVESATFSSVRRVQVVDSPMEAQVERQIGDKPTEDLVVEQSSEGSVVEGLNHQLESLGSIKPHSQIQEAVDYQSLVTETNSGFDDCFFESDAALSDEQLASAREVFAAISAGVPAASAVEPTPVSANVIDMSVFDSLAKALMPTAIHEEINEPVEFAIEDFLKLELLPAEKTSVFSDDLLTSNPAAESIAFDSGNESTLAVSFDADTHSSANVDEEGVDELTGAISGADTVELSCCEASGFESPVVEVSDDWDATDHDFQDDQERTVCDELGTNQESESQTEPAGAVLANAPTSLLAEESPDAVQASWKTPEFAELEEFFADSNTDEVKAEPAVVEAVALSAAEEFLADELKAEREESDGAKESQDALRAALFQLATNSLSALSTSTAERSVKFVVPESSVSLVAESEEPSDDSETVPATVTSEPMLEDEWQADGMASLASLLADIDFETLPELGRQEIADSSQLSPTQAAENIVSEEKDHVLLRSAGAYYALPAEQVLSVETAPRITRVPRAHGIEGLANIRGELVTVIQLNSILGVAAQSSSRRLLLVRSDADHPVVGLLVEEVLQLASFSAPREKLRGMSDLENSLLVGSLDHDNKVITILNLPAIYETPGLRVFRAA